MTNLLNQSTDVGSNAQAYNAKHDISNSFVACEDNEDDISIDLQSAGSSMPSFNGSKMFAKKNPTVAMAKQPFSVNKD